MPADTSNFVAGHYTVTIANSSGASPLSIGTTEQGFRMTPRINGEEIRIDDFGDSVVDGIYRGYNILINCSLSQWGAAGRQRAQFVFDEVVGTLGTVGLIGQTWVGGGFARQIVFTPVSGINSNNKIYTFPLCIPQGDHGGFELNTRLRRINMNWLALVNATTGVVFTETSP